MSSKTSAVCVLFISCLSSAIISRSSVGVVEGSRIGDTFSNFVEQAKDFFSSPRSAAEESLSLACYELSEQVELDIVDSDPVDPCQLEAFQSVGFDPSDAFGYTDLPIIFDLIDDPEEITRRLDLCFTGTTTTSSDNESLTISWIEPTDPKRARFESLVTSGIKFVDSGATKAAAKAFVVTYVVQCLLVDYLEEAELGDFRNFVDVVEREIKGSPRAVVECIRSDVELVIEIAMIAPLAIGRCSLELFETSVSTVEDLFRRPRDLALVFAGTAQRELHQDFVRCLGNEFSVVWEDASALIAVQDGVRPLPVLAEERQQVVYSSVCYVANALEDGTVLKDSAEAVGEVGKNGAEAVGEVGKNGVDAVVKVARSSAVPTAGRHGGDWWSALSRPVLHTIALAVFCFLLVG